MKKFCFTTMIAVFFLIFNNGLQAQTTQSQLNQVESMKQLLGNWQADYSKDTLEVWDGQQYGNAFIISVDWIIKGHRSPLYKNNISFNSNEGKFYGFNIFTSGSKITWTGSFDSEKKLNVEMSTNYNPEKVWGKCEIIFISPNAFTFYGLNMKGVITRELKFRKVK